MSEFAGERLAKVIARAGLCSRREAELWIRAGRVEIDGKTQRDPAINVTGAQVIKVDGERLPALEPARLFRYHKPRGLLTTAKDPEGRPTFLLDLPINLPRVMPVGRLDMDSEGLLLLTNDGELKRHLELPATGWIRRYRVRAHGRINDADLAELAKGITVDGTTYGPIEAMVERASESGHNIWLTMALSEGKNREIRRVLGHLGLEVSRLIRLSYGPFQLGKLAPGEVEEVPGKVITEQVGKAQAPRAREKHAHRRRPA